MGNPIVTFSPPHSLSPSASVPPQGTLASPVADNQTVEVKNADASLWPATMEFKAVAHPQRRLIA